jgi:hypothetical protein
MRVATLRGLHVRRPGIGRLVLLAWLLAVPSRAGAGELLATRDMAVCLALVSPGGCPMAKQTQAAVEDILGRRVFTTQSCDIDVRGAMHRLEHGGWEAKLSFAKTSGEVLGDRSLQSTDASCRALAGPMALAISMMVEAGEAEVTLHVPTAQPMDPPDSDRMSMGFAVSSGLLPRLGYGASAAYATRLRSWLPVQLDATFWFPQATTDQNGMGGQFWAWHAGAAYCPTLFDGSILAATACLGFEAGVIHGTGIGIAYAGSPTKPYGDVNARVRLSAPLLGPLEAWAEVGVGVPWVRAQFVYLDAADASVPVHRSSAVVLFGTIGLALRASGRTVSP